MAKEKKGIALLKDSSAMLALAKENKDMYENLKQLYEIVSLRCDGSTILHHAAKDGNLEAVKFLVGTCGREVIDTYTEKLMTPLHFALTSKSGFEVVKFLLTKGAGVNKLEGNFHNTPLMIASRFGALSSVKMLLDKGAEIDNKTINGETALFYAARMGHKDVCLELLQKGANYDTLGYYNAIFKASDKRKGRPITPKEAAYIGGYEEVVKLIEKFGDKSEIREYAEQNKGVERF